MFRYVLIMRASHNEYLQARNAPKPPRFSTWAREFLAKSTSESEYYDFAADLATYIPAKIHDRKAFDKQAMHFVVDYPNKAFRTIQTRQMEMSTPDLVNMVKKDIFSFIPLITREQKLQYQGAGERLPRTAVSLNRNKLSKESFILISQLHNIAKINVDKKLGPESPLYTDHMYQKYMKQILSDYYDIEGRSAKELWPYWLDFLKNRPIE